MGLNWEGFREFLPSSKFLVPTCIMFWTSGWKAFTWMGFEEFKDWVLIFYTFLLIRLPPWFFGRTLISEP